MLPSPQPGINTVSSYTPLSYVSLLLTPSLSSPPHTLTVLSPNTPHIHIPPPPLHSPLSLHAATG